MSQKQLHRRYNLLIMIEQPCHYFKSQMPNLYIPLCLLIRVGSVLGGPKWQELLHTKAPYLEEVREKSVEADVQG